MIRLLFCYLSKKHYRGVSLKNLNELRYGHGQINRAPYSEQAEDAKLPARCFEEVKGRLEAKKGKQADETGL